MTRVLAVLSGGQSGVDRGALDAALELGAQCGGWCPEGRRAEDGRIPDRYPLTELEGAGYPERTRRNVEDSDGTLIIHCGPLSAGTLLTLQTCEGAAEARLPDRRRNGVSGAGRQNRARSSSTQHDIQRLNVAGPRASHWPEAHDYARTVIRALLSSTARGRAAAPTAIPGLFPARRFRLRLEHGPQPPELGRTPDDHPEQQDTKPCALQKPVHHDSPPDAVRAASRCVGHRNGR